MASPSHSAGGNAAMTSFAERDGFIWYDGELKPWRECTTHVLTYTLHYGVGCFEGVRAYQTPEGTAIFRLERSEEHTSELQSLMRISYAVFCLKKKTLHKPTSTIKQQGTNRPQK